MGNEEVEYRKERNRVYQQNWYNSHKNPYHYIYMLTNKLTGDRYISSTENAPQKRYWQIVADAKRGRNGKIYDAILAYGSKAFTVEVLHNCTEHDNYEELVEMFRKDFKPELN